MPTAAKIQAETGSHFYLRDGTPFYEVDYADPSKGKRKTTLKDAKKHNALPSSTTVLKILDKPALTAWKVETACLAVLTSPRAASEEIDAFVKRVLQVEKEQDAEASKARELGSRIHAEIEFALSKEAFAYDAELFQYVENAMNAVHELGKVTTTEKIVVGIGYAGKLDAIVENDEVITVIDFKTSKNLPKESYPEAKLQLASYAAALGNTGNKRVRTANIYISTTLPGEIAVFIHDDWQNTFTKGFEPLLQVWRWMNDFKLEHQQSEAVADYGEITT